MKINKLIVIALITIIPYQGFSQFVQGVSVVFQTTFHNVDVVAAVELGLIMAMIQEREKGESGTYAEMNKLLTAINRTQRELIDKKYDKSSYDGQSSFYAKAAGTMALKAGQDFLATKFANGKYMTENKRAFIDHMSLDQKILPFLMFLDNKKITAANRQEIYRLRSEVIRQYSKNDKDVRKMLRLALIAQLTRDQGALLLKEIKNLKISL